MSDLRGEAKTKTDAPSVSEKEMEMEHRHLVMYLSVAGVMAFVVALWVMVLPVQLNRIEKSGARSVFTESGTYEEAKPTLMEEWQASVDSVQRAVANLSDGLEVGEPVASTAGDSDLEPGLLFDVEGIREKLQIEPEANNAETGE